MFYYKFVGFSAEHKRSSTPVALVYFVRGKILALNQYANPLFVPQPQVVSRKMVIWPYLRPVYGFNKVPDGYPSDTRKGVFVCVVISASQEQNRVASQKVKRGQGQRPSRSGKSESKNFGSNFSVQHCKEGKTFRKVRPCRRATKQKVQTTLTLLHT